MNIKTKYNNTYTKSTLLAAIFAVCFLILNQVRAAESITSLSNSDSSSSCGYLLEGSDDRKKCDELNKRAEVYREIIDIKKKQGETLSNQLSITDTNIAQVQAEIDASKRKIDDFNSQISRIEKQITEKEKTIESQKQMLSRLMQSYYEVTLANPIISYLSDGNIASFIVQKDRIAQTGDKIAELVASVRKIKEDLDSQSKDLDKKKGEVVLTHETLKDQNGDLQSIKDDKQNLLAQTKGEEARYAQLLARVEAQKKDLLDIDQYFVASGLSADSYPKPDAKSFATTDWFYSQRDPRWGNTTIGNTKTLMKSYGCAVTAVSMVFKKNGVAITPAILAKQSIFSGDLINWWDKDWQSSWPVPNSNGSGHGNINWSTIDAQLAKGNPVIVYIGKTTGSGGHYVVIHHKEAKTGKYVVHDPYFGPNIYLDTTRALVGAMGTSSSTRMDQMIIYVKGGTI